MFRDMMMCKRTIIFAAALLLAGCAQDRNLTGGDPALKVVDNNVLPTPTVADTATETVAYHIGVFDHLVISVFGIQQLSSLEAHVDSSGAIALPLIGQVQAAGKTPQELAAVIERRLHESYIRDPHVSVGINQVTPPQITVEGQVNAPGLYPVIGHMTLQRAVAVARGTNEFARIQDVVIFRVVNGQKYAALYNLKAIRTGAYPDPDVYGNDIVTVGDSKARHVFKDFLSIWPVVTTPLILLVQRF
jgi:polysaccharide export outer membrane protein